MINTRLAYIKLRSLFYSTHRCTAVCTVTLASLFRRPGEGTFAKNSRSTSSHQFYLIHLITCPLICLLCFFFINTRIDHTTESHMQAQNSKSSRPMPLLNTNAENTLEMSFPPERASRFIKQAKLSLYTV